MLPAVLLCAAAFFAAYLAVSLYSHRGGFIARFALTVALVAIVLGFSAPAFAGGCAGCNGGGVAFAPQFAPVYAPAVAFAPQYVYQPAAVAVQRQVVVQRQVAVAAAPVYAAPAAAVVVQPGRQVVKQKSVSRVSGRGRLFGRNRAAVVVGY